MSSKKIKNDLLLIAAILLISLLLLLIFVLRSKNGDYVTVSVDGQVTHTLPLNSDTEITLGTEQSYNILVIKNGYAYISEANCPDKICVQHRKISKTGETIVCLPHKSVIEITKE